MITKLYRLPPELGGGEIMLCGPRGDATHYAWNIGGHTVSLPYAVLTEVPPPTPDEPEPGAHRIGDTVCERDDAWDRPSKVHDFLEREHWRVVGSVGSWTWLELLDFLGCGPDVVIRKLQPAPEPVQPPVHLPWRGSSRWGSELSVSIEGPVDIGVKIGGGTVRLPPAMARKMAAALLTAADAAENTRSQT